MDINSKEGLHAQVEFNKIAKIEKIETKIHRLSYIPFAYFAFLFLAYFGLDLGNNLSSAVFLMIISIGIIGQSNVQRTDLLKELFEVKYGK